MARSGYLAVFPCKIFDDGQATPLMITVLACLSTYADPDGWCWPSVGELSDRLRIARSTVQATVAALIDAKYVERTERFQDERNGRQTSNLYRVVYDPEKLPAPKIQEITPPARHGGPPPARMAGTPPPATAGTYEQSHQLTELPLSQSPPSPPSAEGGDFEEDPGISENLIDHGVRRGLSVADVHHEIRRAVDYLAAHPEKAPTGDRTAWLRRWLDNARAGSGKIPPKSETPAANVDQNSIIALYRPEVPEAWREAWSRVLMRLREELGPVVLRMWFERLEVGGCTSELELHAPGGHHADYIRTRLGAELDRAFQAEFPGEITCRILKPEKKSHAAA